MSVYSVEEEQVAGKALAEVLEAYTSVENLEEGTFTVLDTLPSDNRVIGARLLQELGYLGYKIVRPGGP